MLFIDLEKLKLIKDFHATTFYLTINTDLVAAEFGLIEVQKIVRADLAPLTKMVIEDQVNKNTTSKNFATAFNVHIKAIDESGAATEDEESHFLTMVNIIIAEFFKQFTLSSVRPNHEHRLDVPDKLKGVKCSMGLLKKAINNETLCNVFNLIITYKDLIFILADEKYIKQKQEYLHSADEAPEVKKHA